MLEQRVRLEGRGGGGHVLETAVGHAVKQLLDSTIQYEESTLW